MNNRVEPDESIEVNSNTTRLRTLYKHFRKRKLIWIIFSIILIVVIILVSTITATMKKTKKEKTTTTTNELLITTTTSEQLISSVIINNNTKWKQNASTVAGGDGPGSELNQLKYPECIYVDNDNHSIYIADKDNHRIVRWEFGANNGTIVAGGNGPGDGMKQLNCPTNVILDKEKKYLIICDQNNKRLIRWSRQNNAHPEILIDIIACWGLAMDNNEDLYISDLEKHEVRRFQQGDKEGIVVAGGNGQGNQLNQLNSPMFIFVDDYHSVYISDFNQDRVMKWVKNAAEGILVASPQASNPSAISRPMGVIVDYTGNVYVSTVGNNQVMRWSQDATECVPVVGGKESGRGPTQLSHPTGLSFDRQGNLYVADRSNSRIQKFDIDRG
ncbi:unnamed protein product [Adineta steineri]|uniref:NHL repeat containing protein n=1 Tax=Adineta steineri TaxID=433720 RepID=A0A818YBI4_9BILA|nr:unnamed protein product [Adineta steineri]CAF3753943.1 unnamed protein product [Adineta steineri]